MATINVDSDELIQAAIDDDAEPGDTIDVADGTYDESVTIDVEGLTLKGPNAGIPGDNSSARGDEATIEGKVNIGGTDNAATLSGEVVIDGVEIATTDSGVTDGVVSVADRGEKVEDATIENSVIDTEPSGVGVGIYLEEVDNLAIENNAFTESGSGTSVAVNVAETALSTLNISNNTLTGVDRLYNEGAGFIKGRGITSTTVSIVDNDVNGAGTAIGIGDSEDALTSVDYDIKRNEIEVSAVGILQNGGTPASFTIENNDFTGGSGTIYVDDTANEILDLSAILTDQGNTFDPGAVYRQDSDKIVEKIQTAIDAASSEDTIEVAAGTYNEEVTIGKNITLTEADDNTSTPTISGQVRITGAVGSSSTLEVSELDIEYDSNNAGSGKKSTVLFGQNQYENVTLDNNTITAPTGGSGGYAVYKQESSGGSSLDDDITFRNNTFKSGGNGADQLVVIKAGSNRPTSIDFENNVLTGTVNSGPALRHEGKDSAIGDSGNGNDFTGGSNSKVSRNGGSVLVKTTGSSITIEENDFPTAGGLVISAEGDDTSIKNNSFVSISTDIPVIEATGKNTSISGNTAGGDNLPAEGESEAGNDVQNVIDESGDNETVEIEQGGSSSKKEEYTIDQNQSGKSNKNTVEVNASDVIIKGESGEDEDELQVPDDGPAIEITGGSTGVEIKDVGIESDGSGDTGIVVDGNSGTGNCTITGNSITVNPTAAVEIKNGSSNNVIEDNSLETAGGASGGAGVLIKNAGGGNLIALNDIDSAFDYGIDIEDPSSANASNVTVRFNNLRGDNAGIRNKDDENVDARSNFWDDKTGPSSDGVDDPETGRTADGNGSSIKNGSNDGQVRYDEFLEIPNGFILNTGRDTDGDNLNEDFNDDSDHFPTDGYLFLRALRQGHFDRLAAIDNPGGDLSENYTESFDFDGDGADDITRDDVNEMVINRNR